MTPPSAVALESAPVAAPFVAVTEALPPAPNIDHLITQDDTPVDNLYVEKQQTLLKEQLTGGGWDCPEELRPFHAMICVGLFPVPKNPGIVPDFMLGCAMRVGEDIHARESRSYFVWVYGKPPHLVLEIVSDKRDGEDTTKMAEYAQMRVPYYILFDPHKYLSDEPLRAFVLQGLHYVPIDPRWLEELRLGLTFHDGTYQEVTTTWLRWCDKDGNVIPTGSELAETNRRRAEEESRRAEEQRQRADAAEQEKQRLLDKLKALGIDPNV